jgi:hypothetical protein
MRLQLVTVFAVVFGSLACSGLDQVFRETREGLPAPTSAPMPADAAPSAAAPASSGGSGNAAACQKYIERYNGLPCLGGVKVDAASMCTGQDAMPCDISKYWNCMAENTKCKGAMPDIVGTASCGSPVCM